MSTGTTVAKAKTTSAQTAKAADVQVPGISRREFLSYAWIGSMALLLAQTGGILVWFGLPRFRAGEFGGVFTLNTVPTPGNPPIDNPQGKFWLSATDEGGIVALYKVCTHLGCLYKWVEANGRFECPCHGSMYERSGQFIQGPAPRSLDRFALEITTTSGVIPTNADGDPIVIADPTSVIEIRVDTGNRIKRAGRV